MVSLVCLGVVLVPVRSEERDFSQTYALKRGVLG